MPDDNAMLLVFKDRLQSLRKVSTVDDRGRWFARSDRACDIIPVWTVLRCVLAYRDMRISGMGIAPSHKSQGANGLTKQNIDGGIIKCCVSMLMDTTIRASLRNYAFTCATFRKRSGLRTANRAPPEQSIAESPWVGHPALSVMHSSHAAVGGFIEEIHETLTSLTDGDFDISKRCQQFIGLSSYKYEPAICAPMTYDHSTGMFQDCGLNVTKLISPGAQLIDYIGARVRSQGLFSFGVLAYGALLHQDREKAARAYNHLRCTSDTLKSVMNETNEEKLPEDVLLDLKRLFRDDIYMSLNKLLGKTASVDCCRRILKCGNRTNGPGDENMHEPGDTFTRSNTASSCSSSMSMGGEPTTASPRILAGESKEPSEPLDATACPDTCTCEGTSAEMSLLLQDIFAGLYGTKWTIEDAFNAIRKMRMSLSTNSKGRAENTNISKYIAQHSNSVKKSGDRKSLPVRLSHNDYESLPSFRRSHKSGLEAHFTNQQCEPNKDFFHRAKKALGWGSDGSSARTAEPSFTMVPAKHLLGRALVERLVTTVPQSLWNEAWKNQLIPPGVILWSPHYNEFRVTLDVPSPHMVATWPCQAVCERTSGGGSVVNFHITPLENVDVMSLFIYVYIPKFPGEPEPSFIEPCFLWYAIRSDLQKITDEPTAPKAQLRFATAKQKLSPSCMPTAGGPGGFDEVYLEPAKQKTPSQVYMNIMDTVPVLEWIIEKGMPNTSVQAARNLLFDTEFSACIHADEPTDETYHQSRERIKNDIKRKDHTATFQCLMNAWCDEWTEEQRTNALSQ